MPITYGSGTKTARMTATRDYFAGGSLEIGNAGMATVLATFALAAGGGSISGNVWTLAFVATTVQGAAGAGAGTTAAAARLRRSAANGSTIEGTGLTVGASGSGADIIMTNTNVASGQDVTVTSAAITHAT